MRWACEFNKGDDKLQKIFAILLAALVSGAVHATPLTGSIDSSPGGGMFATGPWGDGGATLSYEVTQVGDVWKYVYQFTVGKKELSHITFQVSDNFTIANVLDGTTSGWSLGTWGDEGGSSPGIPSTMYGLKFDGDFMLDTMITIFSDRQPMWGDFYAKDGKDKDSLPPEVYAFNVGFGTPTDAGYMDMVFGKVLVPDTYGGGNGSVSEPAILSLMALGLIGLTTVRGRNKPLF